MATQSKVIEAQSDKKHGQKPQHAVLPEQTSDLAGLETLPGGLFGAHGNGSIQGQAVKLADVRPKTAQRQALASQIARTQGNLHLQLVVSHTQNAANQKVIQRDPPRRGGAAGEETAEEPQQEAGIEVTEEETGEEASGPAGLPSTAEIEENMRSELSMTESSQEDLYINMPELIAGMGYTASRMQAIITPLQRGRDRIARPAYLAWQQHIEDAERRAAFDAAVIRFETEVGAGVRRSIQAYWQARQAGAPTDLTALAGSCTTITGSLQAESDALFTEEAEPGAALQISDAPALRSRLNALARQLNQTLPARLRGLNLSKVNKGSTRSLALVLTGAGRSVTQVASLVAVRLASRPAGILRQRLTAAIAQAQAAADRLTEFAAQVTAYNQRITNMSTRVMDVNAVPILVPVTRRTAQVSFRGTTARFRTHHESRMAYYSNAFLQISARPARSISSAPAEDQNRPTGDRARRMYDVYQTLTHQGVQVSEAKILATIAGGEGSFGTTQTIDRVRFSWGIIQFQGAQLVAVLRRIRDTNHSLFSAYFEAYGISLGPPGGQAEIRRSGRNIPGQQAGVPSAEAGGVQSLYVYDHSTHQWTVGNEALSVIQGDPRYQTLFIAAAQEPEAQAAQLTQARSAFILAVRAATVTLGGGTAQRRLRIRDFVNNEVAMFGLVERKVATGNIGFAQAMFNRYLTTRSLTPDNLATAPDQPGLATWVRTSSGQSIRWTLADALPAANIDALSNNSYSGE